MSLRELLGWWPQWCAGRMAYQKERAWKVCTTPPTPHTLLTLSMHLFCSIVPKLLLLFSHSVMSDLLWPHGLQHSRLPCPTPSPGVCSLMSVESVMPSNHLTLCCPLLLLPSIFSSIRVVSNESALHIRWPKNWRFSFSISPSNEYSGLIL